MQPSPALVLSVGWEGRKERDGSCVFPSLSRGWGARVDWSPSSSCPPPQPLSILLRLGKSQAGAPSPPLPPLPSCRQHWIWEWESRARRKRLPLSAGLALKWRSIPANRPTPQPHSELLLDQGGHNSRCFL